MTSADEPMSPARVSGPVLGPVSEHLLGKLARAALERGVLVWLDRDGHATQLVDGLIAASQAGDVSLEGSGGAGAALRGQFSATGAVAAAQGSGSVTESRASGAIPVVAFRGSYLETVLALDGLADGARNPPLVVHLPGLTEEDVARTPLFEIYSSGQRHREALTTLVLEAAEGRVTPEQLKKLSECKFATLAEADAVVAGLIDGVKIELPEVFQLGPSGLYDLLVEPSREVLEALAVDGVEAALKAHMERRLGADAKWLERVATWRTESAEVAEGSHSVASLAEVLRRGLFDWALCAEFALDLQLAPDEAPADAFLMPLRALPKTLAAASRSLAQHLRRQHAGHYEREALALERQLQTAGLHAQHLGSVDTFRFEERVVFADSRSLLLDTASGERGDYAAGANLPPAEHCRKALDFARQREERPSFWLQHDGRRRAAWRVLRAAAALGCSLHEHAELLGGDSAAALLSADQVASRYAQGGWQVDRTQRELEQVWASNQALLPGDEAASLRTLVRRLRRSYRAWADRLAVQWNASCRQNGFLPPTGWQQRSLFEQVVRPQLKDDDAVAYVLVDALRYEMGQHLMELLESADAVCRLEARFAELPSVTEVGMVALVGAAYRAGGGAAELLVKPLGNQKKAFRLDGFRLGSARVSTPASRKQALHELAGGPRLPQLTIADVLNRSPSKLRSTLRQSRLVLVESRAIDQAGEGGNGLEVFEAELQNVRAAVERLRDAGVHRFVLTADHGFLWQDEDSADRVLYGDKVTPNHRYVLTDIAGDEARQMRVPLAQLGYETPGVDAELQLLMPESTQSYELGAKSKSFVHGGNSLPERLIPVLEVAYRGARGGNATLLHAELEPLGDALGYHRVKVKVEPAAAQAGLAFAVPSEVELLLEAVVDESSDAATGCVVAEVVEAQGARLGAGSLAVPMGEAVEIFFRLSAVDASAPSRARVQLNSATGSASFERVVSRRFFEVSGRSHSTGGEPRDASTVKAAGATETSSEAGSSEDSWLDAIDDEGARKVFAYLAQHGALSEKDAVGLLGSGRKARRFALGLEKFADLAPFGVVIDASAGVKRYVRED